MSSNLQQSSVKKSEYLVLRDNKTGDVLTIVFPNGIQVGMETQNFNQGIRLPNLSNNPTNTANILYAKDGDIYFNGILVAPAAGSNLTVLDESGVLTTTAASIDFTGPGISVTASGNNVTVAVSETPDSENSVLAAQVFG